MLALPAEPLIWDIAAKRSNECAKSYWARTAALPYRGPPIEGERAARALLGVDRVLDAVSVLAMTSSTEWLSGEGDVELACLALKLAIAPINADLEQAHNITYHAAGLMKKVSSCGKLDDETMTQLEWVYFGLLRDHTQHDLVMYRRLATEPSVLVELLSLLYVSDQADKATLPRPTEAEGRVANNAWQVLHSWQPYGKVTPDRMRSAEEMLHYAEELKRIAEERGYSAIALDQLGKALASSPVGVDGNWPHESVRAVLERLGSSAELREGFVMGRLNLRGPTSRAVGDGGDQERRIAGQYRDWQRRVAVTAPVTSGVLGQLADNFDQDAANMDVRARRGR